ncbi:MAG: protease modulator HflK N-terminal domain-containing protein, partial [Hyphomicrobium sp.]
MPWNNQSGGGGWKGGGNGGGPWGQGPTGGGGQPPDLEEMLKRGQDKVKQVMHGGGVPGPLLFLVAIVAGAIIAWQAFTFRVDPDELGVVMRFGAYTRQEPPGLHFRWPYPIDEVRKPKVTRQNIIEIGMRSAPGGRPG